MRERTLLLLLSMFVCSIIPSYGGLTPNDILVVWNDNPSVATASRGVCRVLLYAKRSTDCQHS